MTQDTHTITREQQRELNGWNLGRFQDTIETVKNNPSAGRVHWCVTTGWDAGFGLDARPTEIHQSEVAMRRRFTLRSDHPPELLGENTGPTAVELLLSGLGACITGTYAAHATARGIPIDALHVDLEGDIDLNGFLQLQNTRPGLQHVRARVHVTSPASDDELQELLDVTRRASPVFDSIANPVPIDASVERAG